MDVRQELLRRFAAPLPEYYTRRIVVFEDDQGGFAADVEQMELPGVRILVMREDEWFTLRRQIESDYAAEDILLYCPKTFARWQDNWLADVFKYSEIFRADYWSLLFEELHIADGVDMRRYARKVGRFFASRDRVAKLGALGKDYRSEQELEIGVMSVLCGLKSASLSGVLGAAVLGAHEEENEKLKAIEKFCGADAFWLLAEKAIGYTGNRDAAELACYLLTSAALLNAPEDAFAGLPGAAARTAFCTRLQSRSSSSSASPATMGAGGGGVCSTAAGQAARSRGHRLSSGTAVRVSGSSLRPSSASSLWLSASSRRPSWAMAAAASRCSAGSVCIVARISA